MPREITPATSLESLRKEAKRWLRSLRAGQADARTRFDDVYPSPPAHPVLRDVQHALAREFGFHSWRELKAAVDDRLDAAASARPLRDAATYAQLADDFVRAYERDEAALQRLNTHYQRGFTFDDHLAEIWRRVYAFRQRSSREPQNYLHVDEARLVIAQDVGFGSWEALLAAIATGTSPVSPFFFDRNDNRIGPRRQLAPTEWDTLIGVMKDRRVAALDAGGLMTDAVLAQVAQIESVTTLALAGSRQLTDAGLRHLAHMPQLETLELTGVKLTDEGLEVLRHLPNLRRFELTWHRGISDKGASHLRHCDRLEHVDLMGTPTGDGLIDALQGKTALRQLNTGRLVSDKGLASLHDLPCFKTWQGGAQLMVDGPFTNAGIAQLEGLEGVGALDLFWHVTGITSDAFASLAKLPHLEALGADGRLSDDVAMRHMAAIPRLRRVRAQEAAASEEGFVALAQSPTLEGFWGRESSGFTNRAFLAFSRMPALHSLGVTLANVDDKFLAAFPDFSALRELTPIGMLDAGFRHIGLCDKLDRLTCMYCRRTGDAATEHIASLRLRYYYAGLTQITDRSLEILGGMSSLEQVEFYECKGITDAGLRFLARLPHLREVAFDSLPHVTLQGTRVLPPRVRVRYST